MTSLAVLLALAITLLAVLIGGLLRSHAEILRSLHRMGVGIGDEVGGAGAGRVGEQSVALTRRVPSAAASSGVDVAGITPEGEPVSVPVRSADSDTLVAFLSSSCSTCAEFWRALRQPPSALDLPAGTRLVIVTKGPGQEDQARIGDLAPPEHPVVMSTEAWESYGVPVTPYFIHVDGTTGEIVGQGSGRSWSQVVSLLGRAVGDAGDPLATSASRPRAGQRVAESEADIDRKLLAAGIRPGDPSLYPSSPPSPASAPEDE